MITNIKLLFNETGQQFTVSTHQAIAEIRLVDGKVCLEL